MYRDIPEGLSVTLIAFLTRGYTMKDWDSDIQHHPFCNLFGNPRKGCRQCEGLYKSYPMDDLDIEEPRDLLYKFFPDVVEVETGKPVGKKMQLPCDVPEGVATSFRGIGFDTEMYLPGVVTETLFFHIGGGPGYERFTNATPEAVEEFCDYYQGQMDTARLYVANGCNPNVHEWTKHVQQSPIALWEDTLKLWHEVRDDLAVILKSSFYDEQGVQRSPTQEEAYEKLTYSIRIIRRCMAQMASEKGLTLPGFQLTIKDDYTCGVFRSMILSISEGKE
jgi:hypothetical protein